MAQNPLYGARWYDNAFDIEGTVDFAVELADTHEGAQITAVGQSLAWPVVMAGHLRKLRGQEARTALLPFSGGFLSRNFDLAARCHGNIFWPTEHMEWPEDEAISGYFDYLSAINLAPAQVAEKAEKTVMVDFGLTGRGFASFLALYLGQAKNDGVLDQLLEKCLFQIFHVHEAVLSKPWQITTPDDEEISAPVAHRHMSMAESLTVTLLSESNEFKADSGRIVPHYRIDGPSAGPPRMPHNQEHIAKVREIALNAVERRHKSLQSAPI